MFLSSHLCLLNCKLMYRLKLQKGFTKKPRAVCLNSGHICLGKHRFVFVFVYRQLCRHDMGGSLCGKIFSLYIRSFQRIPFLSIELCSKCENHKWILFTEASFASKNLHNFTQKILQKLFHIVFIRYVTRVCEKNSIKGPHSIFCQI